MPKYPVNLHAAPLPLGVSALAFAVVALAVAFSVAGCDPDYPDCETDKQCHAKEFCVNRKCQQCRDSNDCPGGHACKANKCEAISGYCRSKADCPANQECIASKCKACANDKECPGGQHCVKGTCTAKTASRVSAARRRRRRRHPRSARWTPCSSTSTNRR